MQLPVVCTASDAMRQIAGSPASTDREGGRDMILKSNSQRNSQGCVHFFHFGIRKGADIVGKLGLGNADQIIAENSAVMLQPFLNANLNLGPNSSVIGIDRGADNAGKGIVDQFLAAYHKEPPVILRVIAPTPVDPVQFSPLHDSSGGGE